MNCPKCGITLVVGTKDCPKCFAIINEELVINKDVTPTDAPRCKAIGAALGFGNGTMGFIIIVVLATVLVMAGYHYEYLFAAIAVCFPVLTMIRGFMLFRQGQCPYCDKIVNGYPKNNTLLKCHSCKNDFRYKDEKFLSAAE